MTGIRAEWAWPAVDGAAWGAGLRPGRPGRPAWPVGVPATTYIEKYCEPVSPAPVICQPDLARLRRALTWRGRGQP